MDHRRHPPPMLLLLLGLLALAPGLGWAKDAPLRRAPGQWQIFYSIDGQRIAAVATCVGGRDDIMPTILNTSPLASVSKAQAKDEMCETGSAQTVDDGVKLERTCVTGSQTIRLVATVRGDFKESYSVDVMKEVDGRVASTFHTKGFWAGACPHAAAGQ